MTEREIGVAVGLPPALAADLRAWRERFGDPEATLVIPHVTLLTPTVVADSELPAVTRHLAAVAAASAPFPARLAGTGTFRPITAVVYLRLATGGPDCAALEAAVRSGPLEGPRRFPFHPHVTVAQDVPDGVLDAAQRHLAGYDASFDVRSFGLFERVAGGWTALREFPLGAPAPAARPAGVATRPDG